ncbi:sigma-54-dependent transcriptional regulator [Bordetella genomosp. 13]|uniref:sigma-54-dependent transcriptional regulator n=1 Tax=Bordetella genomosp. 13 TaxID=463040 RepID=UPI0011A9DA06|nr:sigma-54 dependent transcriptional regulator [Bordetella genomosp. 13]
MTSPDFSTDPRAASCPVMLVDDDADLRRATAQTLALHGYDVRPHADAEAALAELDDSYPGVVVTDVRMPGMDGLEFFQHMRRLDADIPVILITGHGDIAMAVQAMRDGAYDFLAKPYPSDMLLAAIGRAAEKRRLLLENRRLRQAALETDFDDLAFIGATPAMQRIKDTLRHVAGADVDVLIEGETGTGKEVVATVLHRLSERRDRPLVAINCGALPETVIESELFGHEPGAFTGAQKKRIGRIEHAGGGTLFLDEIESMPPAVQVKLLRVLESRQVAPLGTNEVRDVDLRVVAAAKVDLGDAAVRARFQFRDDLYYRLNVVTVHLPPLRERREDIPLLFAHYVGLAARRFRRDVPTLSSAVRAHLAQYEWPGNIRELAHYAERFVLGVLPPAPQAGTDAPAADLPTLHQRVERHEAYLIRQALAEHGGDVRGTLQALGLPRKTFYDKLRKHGIDRQSYAGATTPRDEP